MQFYRGLVRNLGLFCLLVLISLHSKNMSDDSPQHRVRQRTDGELAALGAKIMNRSVIAEQNVVHAKYYGGPL
jgi:hypothetical protein